PLPPPAPTAQPAGSIVRHWNMVPPPEPTGGLVGRRGAHRHKRGYQQMLDSYLEATRYPSTSRPLKDLPTHRLPEAPPTASRSEDRAGGKKVEQQEHQDKYYVAEGESATVTVAITVDGKPVSDASGSGSLVK